MPGMMRARTGMVRTRGDVVRAWAEPVPGVVTSVAVPLQFNAGGKGEGGQGEDAHEGRESGFEREDVFHT